MTAPTTQGVKVLQCDRDAAKAFWVEKGPFRMGTVVALAQAFARHRHTQTAALLSILEELCEKHDTFLGEPRDDNPPESVWARARGLIAFYRGGEMSGVESRASGRALVNEADKSSSPSASIPDAELPAAFWALRDGARISLGWRLFASVNFLFRPNQMAAAIVLHGHSLAMKAKARGEA